MTPTAFKGIVVLDTQAQFEELSTTGTLVIGTETITYQPTSYLYYVKEGGVGVTQQELAEAIADLEAEIPTALSQLTQDSTHRTVTDSEKATWNAKQNAPVIKTGTLNPVSSTVADFVGQFFLNTVYGDLFQCTAISSGVYTWTEVGGGGGGSPIYKHTLHITVDGSKVQEIWGHYYSTDDTGYTPEEFANDGDKKFNVDYLKCDSVDDGMLYANGGKISTSDQPSIGAVQFTIEKAVFVLDDHSSLNLRTTYQSYMFGYPDYGTFVEAIDVDDTIEEI